MRDDNRIFLFICCHIDGPLWLTNVSREVLPPSYTLKTEALYSSGKAATK